MSDNPDEAAYYLRFISMYIDLGTETVLKVMLYFTPDKDVQAYLQSKSKKLHSLKRKKVLSDIEYSLVSGNRVHQFDISLLITLLTNLYRKKLARSNWTSLPDAEDHSIGADLIRLRRIRNSIIGHQTRAKMHKPKFEHLWNGVKTILVRLIHEVEPRSESRLKKQFAEYRDRELDAGNEQGQKYLATLREWWDSCEEIRNIQEKVEELLKRTQDFSQFFTTKQKSYCRYVKLLYEGGRLVLQGILDKNVSESEEGFETILLNNQDKLRADFKDEALYREVFPEIDDQTVNTDVKMWDILTLAKILISVFNVDDKNIRTIIEARNRCSNMTMMDPDNVSLSFECESLICCLNKLSTKSDKCIEEECDRIIETTKEESIDDFTNCHEKCFEQLKIFENAYKATVAKLKETVKEMDDIGVPFMKDHVLELQMMTLGSSIEKRTTAEEILETVWQTALEMSDSPAEFGAVRGAVDRILENIKSIPGSRIEKIERHCILLQIRCYSWRGILSTIEYFDGNDFCSHLTDVSIELSLFCDTPLALQGHFTMECLFDVLEKKQPSGYIQGRQHSYLSVPIRCSSAEGMRKVLTGLGDESTNNSVNMLADALSYHCGERISLKIDTDLKEFTNTGVFIQTGEDASFHVINSSQTNEKRCEEMKYSASRGTRKDQPTITKPLKNNPSIPNRDMNSGLDEKDTLTIHKLREELKKSKKKVHRLQTEIRLLKNQLEESQEKSTVSEERAQELSKVILEKDKEIEDLNVAVENLEKNLNESTCTSQKSLEQLHEIQNKLEAHTKAVRSLEQSFKDDIKNLQHQVEKMDKRQEESQKTINFIASTLNELIKKENPQQQQQQQHGEGCGTTLPDIVNSLQPGRIDTSAKGKKHLERPMWKPHVGKANK
ncbi:uncharacterized protein LOC123534885 [Mercenaria mercenaria]|uniref:uncharacterized protein LOC123534885 n=1 Tax=Mercenaria mercenaria TaxID=6596 RepID=UPI00234F4782|nr:uncharacterized protein LOC123534885 [Mercenaria mercenaria]